ncbi:FG-GAP repeat domain-containing protein [Streptomyces wedmorensis]|uniref:FG-GAP repeat domain-containing protein n=1 Tax=Streptomyces wedmorensis TaxID=43759 RepID=A0ABW6IPV3_STRWE
MSTINRRRRAIGRAVGTAAVAVAMAATAGTAFAAGDPAAAAERTRAEAERRAEGARALAEADAPVLTPTFSMSAVDKRTSNLYLYFSDGAGGFEPRYDVGVSFAGFADSIRVDVDNDGWSDGGWSLFTDGRLTYSWIDDDLQSHQYDIGTGWNIYTKVLSPGSLGGAPEADLIAVDKAGVLWQYLSYPEGKLTPRQRLGGGWGQYTQVEGQGDLTGDGKPDIVARDTSGVLWLYKGTGDYKAPFTARTKVGGGWNAFDRILSLGDLDKDGVSDLIARKPNGELFRYSGTGSATGALYKPPVKIGYGFQVYNLL